MSRRNSKDVRYDAVSQRDLRKLESKKKNKNPRRDGTDWTDKLFAKLNQATEE